MESKNSQLEKTEKNRTKILKKLLGSKIVWGVVCFVLIGILVYNVKDSFFTDSDTKKLGFENIGELATQSAYCSQVDMIKDARSLFGMEIPFTQSQYVYSYDIVIKAGFDFKRIIPDINDKKKVITIHMPKPKILSSEIKEDSCKVYVEAKSCFTPLTVEKMGKARIRMKEVAEKNAIANGLYENATENAKKLLKNFVGELYNLEEYQIKFEEDNK